MAYRAFANLTKEGEWVAVFCSISDLLILLNAFGASTKTPV